MPKTHTLRAGQFIELVTHVALKSSEELVYTRTYVRSRSEYPEKNLSEQGENQQQTQPTYDAG